MNRSMKGSGKKIRRADKESRYEIMVQSTPAHSARILSRGRGYSSGPMGANTTVPLGTIRWTGLAGSGGQMETSTRGAGVEERNTALEFLSGQMAMSTGGGLCTI